MSDTTGRDRDRAARETHKEKLTENSLESQDDIPEPDDDCDEMDQWCGVQG